MVLASAALPLIAALGDPKSAMKMDVAEVLSRIGQERTQTSLMDAALVAPMAAYLAHEDCPVTGEVYTAGAGRFARLFIGSTPGWVAGPGAAASVDDVAAHWDAINDEAGYTVPADLVAWSRSFLDHLPPPV